MEDEFYHLTVKGNDLKTYVRRLQELATLCPTMEPDSKIMMEVFIGELPRSTDISEIIRKPSKTSKHGHENGRVYKSRKPKPEKVKSTLLVMPVERKGIMQISAERPPTTMPRIFSYIFDPERDKHMRQKPLVRIACRFTIKEIRATILKGKASKPFKILKRIGPVAYKLELPEELSNVHNTFHVSNLKKCLSDESLVIPMKELRLDDKLNFVEEPAEIMDREVKQLKQSRIPIVKVRWNSKRGPEITWERKDQIRAKYPHLFSNITPASN
ncbi:hypothetical protein Tco_0801309 [Tanacetum coccineum]|uniref:Tf2-1-like SH3-like domain-containing protein n=1 Tax=Tanacetum coccineum TaxID=301880 RepID=A0ABQ4ZYH8_9ASTR